MLGASQAHLKKPGGAAAAVWAAVETWPDALSLAVPGEPAMSYRALAQLLTKLNAYLSSLEGGFVGLLVGKSCLGYSAALACLSSGRPYVPLSLELPPQRLRLLLARSACTDLIVDSEGCHVLKRLLESVHDDTRPIRLTEQGRPTPPATTPVTKLRTALIPATRACDQGLVKELRALARGQHCQLLTLDHLTDQAPPKVLLPSALAYVMFTSGSTGEPKGVAITHGNLVPYLSWAYATLPLAPGDRCSQTFGLAFDLSVHDLLVTLGQGAALVPPGPGELWFPANYITERQLTCWFSVPSLGRQLPPLSAPAPGLFPHLKYVLFCGETLHGATARHWQRAAPKAQLLNLYGPTEATIACSSQLWTETLANDTESVPIGLPFPQMQTLVVEPASARELVGAGTGELWLAGPQVAAGYYEDPERSTKAFVKRGSELWYRTGDLVKRDERGILTALGRLDHQLKVRGYRVEPGEVEVVLGQLSGVSPWVVVPRLVQGNHVGLIAVYAATEAVDEQALLGECRNRLPSYMLPERFVQRPTLPLSVNGKIDRRALYLSLNNMLCI